MSPGHNAIVSGLRDPLSIPSNARTIFAGRRWPSVSPQAVHRSGGGQLKDHSLPAGLKKNPVGLERQLGLRAQTAFPEDPGLIPSTHVAATTVKLQSQGSDTSGLYEQRACTWYRQTRFLRTESMVT